MIKSKKYLEMEKLDPICKYLSQQLEDKVYLKRKDFKRDFYGPFLDLHREGILESVKDLFKPDFAQHYIHRYRYSYLDECCLDSSREEPVYDENDQMVWIVHPDPKVETVLTKMREFPVKDETTAEIKIRTVLIELLAHPDTKVKFLE